MTRSTSARAFPISAGPTKCSTPRPRRWSKGSNQYAPSRGLPALREAVAAHYQPPFRAQSLDAGHVCVTSGATEALGAAILATVTPGDEVIIFTPAYDCYAPMIRRGGGTVREVALKPPHWRIDARRSSAAIGPKTRAIIFNNPHNPTGRLFGRDELEAIAAIARDHDLIVISDEVWEHIVLDGDSDSRRSRSLPGMAERTIKIGSAGKIFSLTGWKVGWMVAAAGAGDVAARAHQFLTFCTAPNLQSAVAFGLDEGDGWIAPMRERFARARDRMTEGLRDAGFAVLDAQSTYFLCVDLAASGIALDDEAFAAAAVEQAGVAVVPAVAFRRGGPAAPPGPACASARRTRRSTRGVAAMAKAKELLA